VSEEKKESGRSWFGSVVSGTSRVLRSLFPPAPPGPAEADPRALLRAEDVPRNLAILPLRNAVFFPGGDIPLAIGRKKTCTLIREAVRDSEVIGVLTQRRVEAMDPGLQDCYAVGTVGRVVKLLKHGRDSYSMVVRGLARFRVLELTQEIPYLRARVEPVEDRPLSGAAAGAKVQALGHQLREVAHEVFNLVPQLPRLPPEGRAQLRAIDDPGHLANMSAANLETPVEEAQAVLEAVDLGARIELALGIVSRKRDLLRRSAQADAAAKGEGPGFLRLLPSPRDPPEGTG
jgi:ATP-dependent Lon protease